ncbi:MAG TPA: hypothetical protein DDY18_04515 [Flavobacterium sp.]|jgi:hypothetical protein|nr:hypothetical protein [Flavobacterium sp.]
MTSKVKGTITISNPSDGMVSIELRDDKSSARFIQLRMSHEDLAKGLMGLAERPMTYEIKNTEKLNKKKIIDEVVARMPNDHDYSKREEIAKSVILAATLKKIEETGKPWVAEMYFNSQNSFFYDRGDYYVRTNVVYYE